MPLKDFGGYGIRANHGMKAYSLAAAPEYCSLPGRARNTSLAQVIPNGSPMSSGKWPDLRMPASRREDRLRPVTVDMGRARENRHQCRRTRLWDCIGQR